jgi:uncharacterized membrane protein YraQ (UPF0718 family)
MNESVSIFSAVVAAIFIEAMPFLAMGALLSAIIEVFVPAERLIHYVPKGRGLGIALGVTAGMVLPTCECGIVPIVRRLMHKGVPAHVAVAYMLSAPIINPLVIASTWLAFQKNPKIVAARILAAAGIATVTALVADRMGKILVTPPNPNSRTHTASNHAHTHDPMPDHYHLLDAPMKTRGKVMETLRQGAHEFIDMGSFLILGAVAAGLFKAFLPHNIVSVFTDTLFLEISVMMLLSILLSICSEADAFVAFSFRPFSAAAQLAFVTIGPMVDLKLIGMYAVTFRRRFFWFLVIGPTLLVLVLSLLFGVMT